MKAVLLTGNKEVLMVDRPDPQPGFGEVLIQMRASAICRSDMSLYYGNPIVGGESAGKGRVIPGHEPAGDVVGLGEGARNVQVGDRVTVDTSISCGTCTYCRGGWRMLCPQWRCLGFDVDGGDADFMVVPAEFCLKLPDGMSYEAGALMPDNIGTQYHTQKRLNVSGATTVALFGLGPMGGAGVLIGKARGPRVIAVDVLDSRLEIAHHLGADDVINSGRENAVERLRELTEGEGVDVAIDSSGNPQAENAALESARKLGAVAFIGESRSTTINPSDQLIRKQLSVFGCWGWPTYEWEEMVHFVMWHRLPITETITHRFGLQEAPEAFRLFDQRVTDKAIFVW